jgi:galactokinase
MTIDSLMQSRITETFRHHFETSPLLVFAPGRINLIGEHTDYQEGFVFPAAFTQGIYVGIAKNNLSYCRAYSLDFEQEFCFELNSMSPKKGHWATYIMGMFTLLQQAGFPLENVDLVIGGDIPVGAGLSSSAALSVSLALAVSELFDFRIPKKNLALYAQKSEQLFAGVNCGIMDPYASAFGTQGQAMLLDCRSLTHHDVPVDLGDYGLVLIHSKVSHSLASTAYNQRRAACEESVTILQQSFPEIRTLRDLALSDLPTIKTLLPDLLFPKAKHVITECARVHQTAAALASSNLPLVGSLLQSSHQSLRDDFEVSCPELDFLSQQAQLSDAVLGARMMGGGFGGCLLSLMKKEQIQPFKEQIQNTYEKAFELTPAFIEVAIGEGARKI